MQRRLALLVRLVAAFALLSGLAGCGKRARLNPLDPENPATGGRPSGFVALAINGAVELRWDPITATGVLGFQLYREVAGDTAYAPLTGVLGSHTSSYVDFGLLNGVEHRYRLFFVFDDGAGAHPADDAATPGTVRAWLVDQQRQSLVRMTADGHHIYSEDRVFSGPTGVASDNTTSKVWVTDASIPEVSLFDPSTRTSIDFASVSGPSGIAIDRFDHTVWVCDEGLNALRHFDPSGGFAVPPQIIPIAAPLDVAVDPVTRAVWVCERGDNRVGAYSNTGVFAGAVDVNAPSRLAVDSLTHNAWVTSFQSANVVRLTTTPAAGDTIGGFAGPIGIAVDARRGRIWVADALANQVVALRRDGSVEFRVNGVLEAREVDVDLATGDAWITAPGDGSVFRISALGVVLQHVGGLGFPDGISLGVP